MNLGPSVDQTNLNPPAVDQLTTLLAGLTGSVATDPFGQFGFTPAQPGTGAFDFFAPSGRRGGTPAQFTGNPFAQFLTGQPEQLALEQISPELLALIQGGGVGAAQQVIGAAQPIFAENLARALGLAGAAAPTAGSSALALQGADISSQGLRDFNLFQAEALRQGQQTALQAGGLFGQLAQAAGGAQQRFINPTLQLLLAGMGFGQPRTAATVQPGALDYLTQLAPLALLAG
jgi:hypothetical protein